MSDHVGQQLGNYHLLRLIGRVSWASVYLGEHLHLVPQAPIKVLHAHLTREPTPPLAIITQSSRSQQTQEAAGSVTYMAPEQLKGKPRPASDQYALAVVVYEWLSGDPPFTGSVQQIASQHLSTPPPPLHTRVPLISSAVEHVVLKALAKDPQQRFANVQDFAV